MRKEESARCLDHHRRSSIPHQDVFEIKEEIQRKVDKYGLRILGPNRLGLINTSISLNASISDQMALKGSVAFI